jgi:hypothetical protein
MTACVLEPRSRTNRRCEGKHSFRSHARRPDRPVGQIHEAVHSTPIGALPRDLSRTRTRRSPPSGASRTNQERLSRVTAPWNSTDLFRNKNTGVAR